MSLSARPMTNSHGRIALAMLATIALLLSAFATVSPVRAVTEHCDSHDAEGVVKIEEGTDPAAGWFELDGTTVHYVLDDDSVSFFDGDGADKQPLDVEFCVKASNTQSGPLTGSSHTVTLENNGGQTPAISYFVVYGVIEGDTEVSIDELLLTSMCVETDGTNRFRVRNTGDVAVDAGRLTYDVYGTAETGTLGALAAGAELFFTTEATGSVTVRLFLDGQLAETKASNTTPCAPPTVDACPDVLGSAVLGEGDIVADETRSGGSWEFTDDGIVIATQSNTSEDKVALYFDAGGISLADVGEPVLDYEMTSGTVGPGFQLVVDSNGAAAGGTIGILVGEPDSYGDDWWSTTDFGVGAGYGYASAATLDEYLAANPDMTVLAFGFSLGSGIQGSGVVESLTFACTVYTFTDGATGGGDTGSIAVFKTMCESIGQQDTCNGRDTSLDGWMVDFEIYAGEGTEGELVETITVTLGENAEGEGNTGDGSQGRIVSGELEAGTYTVCEVPVAYNDAGDEVSLDAVPRPEAGDGGSTGGGQDLLEGTDCVVVEVTASGTAEVKFLDTVVEAPADELGTIIVAKATSDDTDADFAFTFDDDPFSLESGATATFDELPAGEYTVVELLDELGDDWSLASVECVIVDDEEPFPDADATIDVGTGTAVVDLAEGQTVLCLYLNEMEEEQVGELGSITIVKTAVGANAATTEFDFTTTESVAGSVEDFSLLGGGNELFASLEAGSYTFTEAALTGWRLAAITCTAGGSGDLASRTATVTLAAGASVTCVFTNVAVTGGVLPGQPSQPAQPAQPAASPSPRGGVLGGTLPNTAIDEPATPAPIAGLLGLLMLGGMTVVGTRAVAEARRRR